MVPIQFKGTDDAYSILHCYTHFKKQPIGFFLHTHKDYFNQNHTWTACLMLCTLTLIRIVYLSRTDTPALISRFWGETHVSKSSEISFSYNISRHTWHVWFATWNITYHCDASIHAYYVLYVVPYTLPTRMQCVYSSVIFDLRTNISDFTTISWSKNDGNFEKKNYSNLFPFNAISCRVGEIQLFKWKNLKIGGRKLINILNKLCQFNWNIHLFHRNVYPNEKLNHWRSSATFK